MVKAHSAFELRSAATRGHRPTTISSVSYSRSTAGNVKIFSSVSGKEPFSEQPAPVRICTVQIFGEPPSPRPTIKVSVLPSAARVAGQARGCPFGLGLADSLAFGDLPG